MFERINDVVDYLKGVDWKQFAYRTLIPSACSLVLGSMIFGGRGGGNSTPNKSVDNTIYSVVDLPTQISHLQNSELAVFKQQLANLQAPVAKPDTTDTTDSIGKLLANVNDSSSLDSFFTTYLALDPKSSIDSQFKAISAFLSDGAQAGDSDKSQTSSGYMVQQNIYSFLGSNSWQKSTGSQTALAGSVSTSLLTGSLDDARVYQCIVPATNQKRQFALLNYIVKTDSKGKIISVSYTGNITGYSNINAYYDKLQQVLKNNVELDKDGKYTKAYKYEPLPETESSEEGQ